MDDPFRTAGTATLEYRDLLRRRIMARLAELFAGERDAVWKSRARAVAGQLACGIALAIGVGGVAVDWQVDDNPGLALSSVLSVPASVYLLGAVPFAIYVLLVRASLLCVRRRALTDRDVVPPILDVTNEVAALEKADAHHDLASLLRHSGRSAAWALAGQSALYFVLLAVGCRALSLFESAAPELAAVTAITLAACVVTAASAAMRFVALLRESRTSSYSARDEAGLAFWRNGLAAVVSGVVLVLSDDPSTVVLLVCWPLFVFQISAVVPSYCRSLLDEESAVPRRPSPELLAMRVELSQD